MSKGKIGIEAVHADATDDGGLRLDVLLSSSETKSFGIDLDNDSSLASLRPGVSLD